jgi:hypothetical protein
MGDYMYSSLDPVTRAHVPQRRHTRAGSTHHESVLSHLIFHLVLRTAIIISS